MPLRREFLWLVCPWQVVGLWAARMTGHNWLKYQETWCELWFNFSFWSWFSFRFWLDYMQCGNWQCHCASNYKMKMTPEMWPGSTVQLYSDWCTMHLYVHLGQVKCVCHKSHRKRWCSLNFAWTKTEVLLIFYLKGTLLSDTFWY